MSFKFNRGTKDKNHDEVVGALRKVGADVLDLHTVGNNYPDCLAVLNDAVLIEIKTTTGMFYISQLRFLAEWKKLSAFASTAEEAICIVRNPKEFALSERDKRIILKICMEYEQKSKDKRPRVDVKTFDKLFEERRKERS